VHCKSKTAIGVVYCIVCIFPLGNNLNGEKVGFFTHITLQVETAISGPIAPQLCMLYTQSLDSMEELHTHCRWAAACSTKDIRFRLKTMKSIPCELQADSRMTRYKINRIPVQWRSFICMFAFAYLQSIRHIYKFASIHIRSATSHSVFFFTCVVYIAV